MTIALYCMLYAGVLVFAAGCVVRAVSYASQPIHLRWEIYPLPHGTSGQLKIMVPEILFLRGLWEFNRPMWWVSYPFHLGLYLIAAAVAFLAGSALAPAALWPILHGASVVCGTAGPALGLLGASGLLIRRLSAPELKGSNAPGDFLNLLLFISTTVLILAGVWLRPAGSPGPGAILRGAATFNYSLQPPHLLTGGFMLGCALLAYIPMTHMAHFIAKYFTYHSIRWDERGSVAGGAIEKKMAEYLMYRPTWAASHVGADGQRTWADIATTNPTKGVAK
jgi:nitrate reductase gamma subunit